MLSFVLYTEVLVLQHGLQMASETTLESSDSDRLSFSACELRSAINSSARGLQMTGGARTSLRATIMTRGSFGH